MSKTIITHYLADIGKIHDTGAHVAETSFYPALERLLTDIGSTLSPKVRCVINPKNRGAGIPDGGLFTADQFPRDASEPAQKTWMATIAKSPPKAPLGQETSNLDPSHRCFVFLSLC